MEPTPPDQNPGTPWPGGPPPGQGVPGYPPAGQGSVPPGYPPPGPQYPQYPGGSQLPPPPGSGGLSSMAVVGLVFSAFAAIPVGATLCIVALTRIPRLHQRGKSLAIIGLVICGLWLAAIILGVFFSDGGEPDRDASGQVTTTQNTRPDKLRVGDCVTSLSEGEVKDIQVQPCEQPNGGKVFAVFDLPAGDWPGLAAVQAAAEKGCTDRFMALKQPAAKPSDVYFLHPVEAGWVQEDRGTTCLLVPQ